LFTHYQTIWCALQGYAWEIVVSDSESNWSYDEEEQIDTLEDFMQDDLTTDICDSFLVDLSTDELLWIQEFSEFLLQDIDCTLDLENEPPYFTEYKWKHILELSLGKQQLFCFNLIFSRELDSWRHFFLSNSVENVGYWTDVFIYKGPGPTHLQRKELWLTDVVTRVLQARGFRTEAEEEQGQMILMTRGILVPSCE
jgi:hypothetical protein